tara:strand:+ start:107 stop:1015 length:909 start_codon:yes stop_codon:yes gene_type:complete
MKISIIIPTRNRPKLLKKTLNNLSKNNFFFMEIIVVDSSNNNAFLDIKNFPFLRNKIKIYKSKPSISIQRNIGLKKVNKKSDYVMFLDDDVNFKQDAFKNMHKFLIKNKLYAGIGFNLIINEKFFFEKIKKNKIFELFNVYNKNPGIVTSSGWHTKAINLNRNTEVEWLPTQAVIYKKKILKNFKFEELFGRYSYLEDLDFSYNISKIGKLIINYNAKYSSKNVVERNFFIFGLKEIVNRYLFVKKNKLNKVNFFFGTFFLLIKNIIFIFINNYKFIYRFIGNILGILLIPFGIKKTQKFLD